MSNWEHSEKVGKQDMAHQKDASQYLLQQFTWAGQVGGQSDPPSCWGERIWSFSPTPWEQTTAIKAIIAIAGRSTVTQTELPQKHAPVQVCSCRQGLSLALAPESRRDYTCVQWYRVDDLLSLMAELREEVERLKNIRESDRKTDWWKILRKMQEVQAQHKLEELQHSCWRRTERGDLKEKEEMETGPCRAQQENCLPCLYR